MQCPVGVCTALAAAWEGGAGAASHRPPPSLCLPPVPRGACSGLPRPGLPCPRLLVRHSMWSVRSASSVRLSFRCAPRVRCVFVCSSTRGVRVCPRPSCRFARALREVPSQVAGRAVPGGSCPSAFPARVPCLAGRWWGGGGGGPALASPVLFPGGVEGCSGLGTVPPPTVRPWSRQPGAAALVSSGAGSDVVGAGHHTQSARSRGSALCAWGGGTRAPAGGAPCPSVGRPGLGALPPPAAGPWGRLPGTAARVPWARGVWAWGPVTNPTARALASWLSALGGRQKGTRWGGLLPDCGTSGVGRSPTPDRPPLGRAAGARYPLAVGAAGCGRGDPSPTPQRAPLRARFAHCGGGTRAP